MYKKLYFKILLKEILYKKGLESRRYSITGFDRGFDDA
jgi:hypothetical protein